MSLVRRRHRYKAISATAALLAIVFCSEQQAKAGDLLSFLTSSVYQDSVVIGTVRAINAEQLIVERERVLLGDRTPKTLLISGYDAEEIEALSVGDDTVVPLVRSGNRGQYTLSHDAFKVSTSQPENAKIITGPLSGSDRIAYNWFINSCGTEKDFAFDYSGETDIAFVKRDAELVAIARRTEDSANGEWVPTAESPDCQTIQPNWWQSLIRWFI